VYASPCIAMQAMSIGVPSVKDLRGDNRGRKDVQNVMIRY